MNWNDWMDLGRMWEAGASKSRELGNAALGEVFDEMAQFCERLGQAKTQEFH